MLNLFAKRSLSMLVTAVAVAGISWPLAAAAAEGEIAFMLNAKPVTSVPVDQLGKVSFTAKSGAQTFKQFYQKFWQEPGTLASGLVLNMKRIPKGEAPSYEGSGDWGFRYYFADNKEDSEWPDAKTVGANLKPGALALKLWEVETGEDMIFAVHYSKEKKTGKTIWVNGGWVDETFYDRVGLPVAKGKLTLGPPTAENTPPDGEALKSWALEQLNTQKMFKGFNNSEYATAAYVSHQLAENEAMVKTGLGEGLPNFDGAKFTDIKMEGPPVYNWNFREGSPKEILYVTYKASADLHVARTVNFIQRTEYDAHCSDMELGLEKVLGEKDWQFKYFTAKGSSSTTCKKK